MRYINILFFLVVSVTLSFSQPAKLFKTHPLVDASTPLWAVKMYNSNPNVWEVDELFKQSYKNGIFEKTSHTQNYKYWRRQVAPFVQQDGTIQFPTHQELAAEDSMYNEQRSIIQSRANGWVSIGPFETKATEQGEPEVSWQANVYCIDIAASNSAVLYCGTEGGGVFKTTDKGLHWTWASLGQTFTTIHAIKIHPTNPNIVFAGDGQRIYKTTDGGLNWATVYSPGSLGVNDICINANNTDIILAACDLGLYRSIDAGSSWSQVYNQACWDLELKPGNANVVYLLKNNPIAKRCEFFRSIDMGMSFTLQDAGWYNSTDASRTDDGARMTVTPADTNRIYCVLIGNSKPSDLNYIGIYKSTDGGSNWINPRGFDGSPYTNTDYNLATYQETSGFDQGYYNLSIAASHTNADILFVGCLSLSKSVDGGSSFTYLGGYHGDTDWLHPDQQDLKISGSDQWVANDGGIAYSTNDFSSIESRKNGIAASDFWGFGSGWNEDILVGGRYHNGNTGRNSNYPSGKYHRLGGAEAPTGYVNPGNEFCYFSDISTKVLGRFYNESAQSMGNLSLYPNEAYYGGESGDIEFHPNCYNVLYMGNENKIYRSTDGGNSFDSLYAFGTNTTRPVLQIEISRSNPEVIYAYALQTAALAKLLKSTDGGQTWQVKNFPTGISSAASGSITLSGTDENYLWVCFGHNNNNNKVFVTKDGGDTWTNLTSTALNGHRAYHIVHQLGTPSLVYLATNKAVFYRDSTMADWQLFNAGLPGIASGNLLRMFYKNSKIRLATYGHGLWETDLVQASSPVAQPTVDKLTSYCSRDTFYFDSYSVLNQTNATFSWTITPQPQFISSASARNPKVVFGSVGNYNVSLTVNDGTTSDTKTINNMIAVLPSQCNADTIPGKALLVSGTENYAITPPLKIGNTNTITYSAWIKPYGIQNDYAGVLFADNDGGCGLNFKSNNRLGYHWAGASGSWSWNNGPIIDSNAWNHVALVITPDSATIYWNGVAYTRKAVHPLVDFQAPVKIGRDRFWDDRTFNGLIDEVCIYNRALGQNEIRELRHLTRKPESDASLVAYYQFNETEGLALDKAGVLHASLLSAATREISSAPVGGGVSQRITINTGNPLLLTNVNATLDFNAVATSPQGEIVMSRLNVLPYNSPDTLTTPQYSYYILNNYGLNNSNLDIDSFVLNNLNFGTQYLNQTSAFSIHSRVENADGSWLSNNIHPSSVNADNNGSISFQDNAGVHLNPLGQLVVSRTFISSSETILPEVVRVYPNPVSLDGQLFVETALKKYKLEILDAGGKLMYAGVFGGHETLKKFVAVPGAYTLKITEDGTKFTRQLIVK
jgi:photosystem II stability/assembly factor-like uncharacterized protein